MLLIKEKERKKLKLSCFLAYVKWQPKMLKSEINAPTTPTPPLLLQPIVFWEIHTKVFLLQPSHNFCLLMRNEASEDWYISKHKYNDKSWYKSIKQHENNETVVLHFWTSCSLLLQGGNQNYLTKFWSFPGF